MSTDASEDGYRLAAEAWASHTAAAHDIQTTPAEMEQIIADMAHSSKLRAIVDAARKAERDQLCTWIKTELSDIAADPDLTSGDAIWREDGYTQALRDVLAQIEVADGA